MKNKIVFSTNPNFQPEEESTEINTPEPSQQILYVSLERLGGGKIATVVGNFVGKADDLETLGKLLKTRCGVGGAVKEGRIIIQGEKREKVMEILQQQGYKTKKKGG
ncbi:MAG: translation initiation factor [Chitinophagales bacterium]